MAFDIGAELTGMKRVQFEPCVAVYPEKLRGVPDNNDDDLRGGETCRFPGQGNPEAGAARSLKRELAELIVGAVSDGGD